jgi:hypothetical protein
MRLYRYVAVDSRSDRSRLKRSRARSRSTFSATDVPAVLPSLMTHSPRRLRCVAEASLIQSGPADLADPTSGQETKRTHGAASIRTAPQTFRSRPVPDAALLTHHATPNHFAVSSHSRRCLMACTDHHGIDRTPTGTSPRPMATCAPQRVDDLKPVGPPSGLHPTRSQDPNNRAGASATSEFESPHGPVSCTGLRAMPMGEPGALPCQRGAVGEGPSTRPKAADHRITRR